MTTPTQGEHAQPEALQDFEVRKLAAIGAVSTSSGLVERRPIEYRRELEDQFVRGFRAAEKRLAAQVAALTAAPQGGAYAELPNEGVLLHSDGRWNLVTKGAGGFANAAFNADQMRDFADRTHALRVASHGQAPAGATDWWRKRADEIEAQVAVTGSQEAMRCYTDMRTLLQAATAQPAPAADLHPKTADLVQRFAAALAEKLAAAEKKYGYSDGWASDDWMDECRQKLLEHVAKGDPRDVAAYCAFLWHHGASTAPAAGAVAGPMDELAELSLLNRLIELGNKAAGAHATSNSDDGHKGTAAHVEWQELRAEMGELIRTAYAAAPTPPAQAADSVLEDAALTFTSAHIDYVARYGGRCRDCADESGVCPGSGLPCADSRKAIKHVFDALEYGVKNGFIKQPIASRAKPAAALLTETCPGAPNFDGSAAYELAMNIDAARKQGANHD